jgi:hypothetical protein
VADLARNPKYAFVAGGAILFFNKPFELVKPASAMTIKTCILNVRNNELSGFRDRMIHQFIDHLRFCLSECFYRFPLLPFDIEKERIENILYTSIRILFELF